jgi:hypothetical protein
MEFFDGPKHIFLGALDPCDHIGTHERACGTQLEECLA